LPSAEGVEPVNQLIESTLKNKTAIAGIGHTEFSRSIGRPERRIALEAIRAALADAGLVAADVDGLVRFDLETSTEIEIARNLGIENLRFYDEVGYGGGSGCAAVLHAAMAVALGIAEVVVCWRARNRGSGGRPWAKTGWRMGGDAQFYAPFGLLRPVDQIALLYRRYLHDHDAPHDAAAPVAVACRKHAARNPHALMREPITVDDYRRSRPVSEPLRLLDCCLETDGALAVVVTSAARARDLRHPVVTILAGAQATGPECVSMANYHKPIFLETPSAYCAPDLWRSAGIGPRDVDVAEIYDAFTPLVLLSLEEYGFCGRGEATDFVRDGRLEWPNGELPTNTSGGSLSEAYVHGFNLILEGVRQIRGTSSCQVDGAEVALVTSGAGVPTSALLLARN
jgi:acetyl-CoA acetyltransferase